MEMRKGSVSAKHELELKNQLGYVVCMVPKGEVMKILEHKAGDEKVKVKWEAVQGWAATVDLNASLAKSPAKLLPFGKGETVEMWSHSARMWVICTVVDPRLDGVLSLDAVDGCCSKDIIAENVRTDVRIVNTKNRKDTMVDNAMQTVVTKPNGMPPPPPPAPTSPPAISADKQEELLQDQWQQLKAKQKDLEESQRRLVQQRAIVDEGFTETKAEEAIAQWGDGALLELQKYVQAIVGEGFKEKQAKDAICQHGAGALEKLLDDRKLEQTAVEERKLDEAAKQVLKAQMLLDIMHKGLTKEQAEALLQEYGDKALEQLEEDQSPDADQNLRVEEIKTRLVNEDSYVHACKYYFQGTWRTKSTTFAFNTIRDGDVIGHAFNNFVFSLRGKFIEGESLNFVATAENGNAFSFTFQWVDGSWKGSVQNRDIDLHGIDKAAYMVALSMRKGK